MIEAILIILASVVLLVALFFATRAYKVAFIDKRYFARYWRELAATPKQEGAVNLVALGDSTFQALGASKPLNGTVGLVADYLKNQTGRPVHIKNLSVSGAKAEDVAERQLWQADFKNADIVMVAVGANDVFKKTDLSTFEKSVGKIVSKLPKEKSVIADVAFVKNREPYQQKLLGKIEKHGLTRAKLADGFKNADPKRNQTASDFFHPNDYGYTLWFEGFRPQIDILIRQRKLAK